LLKYDKQDRQGKAAFNERSPHPTQHGNHGNIRKQETWQCHETRFSIITFVDKYVAFEIQIQATM
jgi:hypothetical protein